MNNQGPMGRDLLQTLLDDSLVKSRSKDKSPKKMDGSLLNTSNEVVLACSSNLLKKYITDDAEEDGPFDPELPKPEFWGTDPDLSGSCAGEFLSSTVIHHFDTTESLFRESSMTPLPTMSATTTGDNTSSRSSTGTIGNP